MKAAQPEKTAKKHHLISAQLRERILSGAYADQIPGQRVLAEEFGVNFLTIRKAVATLVKEGMLDKQSGRGTFVTRLKRTRTRNIAAVLGGLSYGFGGQHPKLVEGIQAEAAKFKHDVILRPHLGDPQLERQAIEDLITQRKCDGILVWPTRNEGSQAVDLLKAHGVPFVIVMRVDARYRQDVSYVVDDDFEGGYIATKHLLALGHRKLGFVGRSAKSEGADSFEEERWLGFIKAHNEAGLAPGPRVQADWLARPEDRPAPISKTFLRRIGGLTGLVCVNDRVALHLLSLPKYTSLTIPESLSIVGYDDLEAAGLFNLTTVHQPLAEIGAEAVRLLIDEIEGRRSGAAQRKLAPRLVVRDTTAARPA
ncbi:MAG: GntR family transcriptional regulator [Verrucomicrobiota bacterium]|nr:GntR family transcriptional regulator [Verrucomicrobiota bacterium]